MLKLRFTLLLFIITCDLSSGFAAQQQVLHVFFSANRQGEIEPCGCQTGQVGGLNRMADYLSKKSHQKSTKNTLFLESGDSFFESFQVHKNRKIEAIEKSKLIARSYKQMGLNVFTPGDRDFAMGFRHLKELEKLSGAKFISVNLTNKNNVALYPGYEILSRGSFKIAVLGVSDPEAFNGVSYLKVQDPISNLKKNITAAKKQGANYIVVLSHSGLEKDRVIAKATNPDLIVGAHSLDVLTTPVKVGPTTIVQTNIEGQQIGHFAVDKKKQGSPSHRLVELDEKFEVKNSVWKLFEAHKKNMKKLLAHQSLKERDIAKKRPWVAHAATCKQCHQKQYDFWATTKHSSAYLVLFADDQHFNPECIGCHSIGYEEKGAFEKISTPIELTFKPRLKKDEFFVEKFMKQVFGEELKKGKLDSRKDPKRHAKLHKRYHTAIDTYEGKKLIKSLYMGVQCEHCHGRRVGHPGSAVKTQKKVLRQNCLQCHRPPNDPSFDFVKTLSKVACPKLGS